MQHNPTFGGPGKKLSQFKTRMPVGKIGKKFNNIPRVGRPSVPLFGNKVTPIKEMKALTPAFRGPAKLPSNFMKNIPGLGQAESRNPRARSFNGPFSSTPKRRKRKSLPNK